METVIVTMVLVYIWEVVGVGALVTYEWALESMRHITCMNMEHLATIEGLQKLLKSLQVFLSQYPPLPDEIFTAMLDAAQKLNSKKLLDQCFEAKARCQATHKLLQFRQARLQRILGEIERQQIFRSGRKQICNSDSVLDLSLDSNKIEDRSSQKNQQEMDQISLQMKNGATALIHNLLYSSKSFMISSANDNICTGGLNRFEDMDQTGCMDIKEVMDNMDEIKQSRGMDPKDGMGWNKVEQARSVDHKDGIDDLDAIDRKKQSDQNSLLVAHLCNFQAPPGNISSYESPQSSRKNGQTSEICPDSSQDQMTNDSGYFDDGISPNETEIPLLNINLGMTSPNIHVLLSASLSGSSSCKESFSLNESQTEHYSETLLRKHINIQSPLPIRRSNISSLKVNNDSIITTTRNPVLRRSLLLSSDDTGNDASFYVSQPFRRQRKILKLSCFNPLLTSIEPQNENDVLTSTASHKETELIINSSNKYEINDQRCCESFSTISSSDITEISMPGIKGPNLDENQNHEQRVFSAESSSLKNWASVPVNTHLHCSASSAKVFVPSALEDLGFSEAEIKSRRTVSLIISEMIQTERDYVRALQFITEFYVPELQREDVPQVLRGKRTVIFGNLEKIYQFHCQYFLKDLEKCQNQPFLVGQCFLEYETMFYQYALYNKNKPKSDILMMEYGKKFFRQKQLELGDKMDLSSYLLKPVQRMGKYALLLKQLLKECTGTELEYPDLQSAEEMVRFQLRHGNDLLAMDYLRNCDVNLHEQGRLLRQEEFLVFQGRKKSMRRIFLFEDLILFTKTKRGRQGQNDLYIYKSSFKTADIGLTENYGDMGHKFEIWFRRRSVGDNYVLQAANSEIKRAWVHDISYLLWRQAKRNRESHMNELATMGIGSKPLLDIKPSKDNIHDRSINILLSKEARTRNSVAISLFGYLQNGNKRPHSVISVSSTSSSGSSQSSSGLPNLAFDPLASQYMNHTSLLSHEIDLVTESCEGDLSSECKAPVHISQSRTNSVRSYFDVVKSRVLKFKHSNG